MSVIHRYFRSSATIRFKYMCAGCHSQSVSGKLLLISEGMSIGAIIGIVIAVVMIVIAIIVLLFCCKKQDDREKVSRVIIQSNSILLYFA